MLPDPNLGLVVDSKYRIDARLGAGGQGLVYRATHVHLRRPVAFKIIRGDFVGDPDMTERFKREAQMLALMKHPSIVTVHDFGIATGIGAYLVLEFLYGLSVRDELRQRLRFPASLAFLVMGAACDAVQAAHNAGIVHRDLKPENIFLEYGTSGSLAVKVLDFGIAKLTHRSGLTNDTASLTGKLAGTPAYMSPEQCAGSPPDARSDVYSLGCVLYEMLTGRPPFVAPALLHLLQMHVDAPPTPPSHYAPHIPPELDVAVLRALAKSRHDRYQTPLELMDALATVPAPSTWPGGSGSLPYDPPPGTPAGVNTLTPSHDSQSDSLPTLGTHVAPVRAADEE